MLDEYAVAGRAVSMQYMSLTIIKVYNIAFTVCNVEGHMRRQQRSWAATGQAKTGVNSLLHYLASICVRLLAGQD